MFEYTQEMADSLIKSLEQVEVKAQANWKTVYKMCISKEVPDRDWETVILAWIDTKWYKKNPIVLEDHEYEIESIIGKTIRLYIEGNKMYADYVFADTDKWVMYESLVKEWFVNVSSIWFIVKERDMTDRSIITKSELLEWSLVAVSCNREALSEGQKSLLADAEKAWLTFKTFKSVDEDNIEVLSEVEQESKEITMKDVNDRLDSIESMLKSLVDDKTKQAEQDNLEAKRQEAQKANRLLSEALQSLKLVTN